MDADQASESARPLAARSIVVGSSSHHLWGSPSPVTVGQSTYVDPSDGTQGFSGCISPRGLCQITTVAVEYLRSSEEADLFPLDEIAYTQPPVGIQPPHRRTQIQLRVAANDGSGRRIFEMDANQSITIVAQDVCIDWLGPAGTRDVQGWNAEQRANAPLSGLAIDCFLDISLTRIESAPGANSTVTLTKHLFVPAATIGAIAIPAYAQSVTISQEPTLGTASVMWTQIYGNPAFLTLAALPFIPGQRQTTQQSLLSNASHLRTDIDPDFARFFTLAWVIRP